ncbi:unnamed protein product [Ranitomeya imitator]|uniref:Reverse transcriptase domain-containing protein n=1 Tax=Ranitomeya imitator TaxID=111125 RepID=A0ABN9LV39_9NEOB|nr:unnamed protein product [Ranitomeya imitator]
MSFNTVSYGQAEADEIISQVKIPGEFLHTPVEEIRSRDWERELRKRTSLELHYVTLAEYHKNRGEVGQTEADEEGLRNTQTAVLESELGHRKVFHFVPHRLFNEFQLDQELRRFFRNIRLKAHFASGDFSTTSGISIPSVNPDKSVFTFKELNLSISSKYNPPKSYHPVETYISLVTQDIKRECAQINQGFFPIKRNCTIHDKRALDNLKKNSSITIKSADKGGAIVVMDTSFYQTMVHQHLDDRNTYLLLDRDPTSDISKEIQQLIKIYKEQNVIDTKLGEFLLNLHPVVPVFYALPKIHKHLTCPPGRPIVASTNSILSPLAMTIEKILTPLLVHITSFIRDTSDFLEGLKSIGSIHQNCLLVTMDVNSLYTSIDHQKGLEAKVGTAMGSNMAPPYANIFMASFEEHYVYTHYHFQQYCIYWKRYIDDVFLIWGGDEISLLQFYRDLNSYVSNLTFSISKDYHSNRGEVGQTEADEEGLRNTQTAVLESELGHSVLEDDKAFLMSQREDRMSSLMSGVDKVRASQIKKKKINTEKKVAYKMKHYKLIGKMNKTFIVEHSVSSPSSSTHQEDEFYAPPVKKCCASRRLKPLDHTLTATWDQEQLFIRQAST